jgi:predicted acylesterase/phospholipase RssA
MSSGDSSDIKTQPDAESWPTIAKLINEKEATLRRVLRWHAEAGFDSKYDESDMETRRLLDEELAKLTILELEAEAGGARQAAERDLMNAQALPKLAIASPAFRQYLHSYLYFGIRFALGRNLKTDQSQWNERPIGLPAPPDIVGIEPDELKRGVDDFRSVLQRQDGLALDFLDGFDILGARAVDDGRPELAESSRFELWLRGLLFDLQDEKQFENIAKDLIAWANERHDFYVGMEEWQRKSSVGPEERKGEGGGGPSEKSRTPEKEPWIARNPLAARCGVADLYWLARILRAEVTPRGVVSYNDRSWLYYLSLRYSDQKNRLLRVEEVLRSVFDFACELIQNAVEIAESSQIKLVDPPPDRPGTEDWRAAYDQEMVEIANQRMERLYKDEPSTKPVIAPGSKKSDAYWSRRILSGEHEENLVGLALSGGGIRSATFGLGVLQALKEFDRLRQVDYLSTVSGGGYIGAWLLGNVRRTHYWLSRMTSWDESIAYLRRYSKYLAPQSGILSADSWVIWGTWLRNAFLIQLTAISWLAALFVAALGMKLVFDGIANGWIPTNLTGGVLTAVFVALTAIIFTNLWNPELRRKTQHRIAVGLAWIGSFLTAALLWHGTCNKQEPDAFSDILKTEWTVWYRYLTVGLLFCLFLLAFCSIWRQKTSTSPGEALAKLCGSAAIALVSSGVSYLALCGVVYLFNTWAYLGKCQFGWYAYVLGPGMVLAAITLAVMVFVGLVGRNSADWRREWWTRYGSWLAIYGAASLATTVAAVFGPVWVVRFVRNFPVVSGSAVAGWAGSVIAGLLAGNSNRTKGDGTGSSKTLEWLAKIGGLLFIVGTILAVSTLLHVILVQVWLKKPMGWWENLNGFLTDFHGRPTAFPVLVTLAVLVTVGVLFSWRFNINTFGLNQFYRNRLVRCYLGATRWKPGLRHPEVFTGFDDDDDFNLTTLRWDEIVDGAHFRGPFPVVNCALNLGGSDDLSVHTRQSASFTLTPRYAGANRPKVGFALVKNKQGFADSVTLGQAISISGAAASPNMGYNTSPLVAVLLTMFNVRLAWWFPNPGRKKWKQDSPVLSLGYLGLEFLGMADENSNFVNVSDGGHFENLGIYELVRRRTRVIIASDAECDSELAFGSLGNVIRICETDFGAKIDIDVSSIRKQCETGRSLAHCAVGRITYSNGSLGYLIYLKASITGDEEPDIQQYRAAHPDFPHQSTADQFFTEDQFESYRRLGQHVAHVALAAGESEPGMVALASKLFEVWAPARVPSSLFINHARTLDKLWERFRTSEKLQNLLAELMADRPSDRLPKPDNQERCACLELLQLMENVFLDLRLDDFWEHPDNRGWALLFTMWAKSSTFRAVWEQVRGSFGIRFEYFCEQRLGLTADHPVRRV